jgi:Na+-translocating ferredoxin:NAD+ oxidoreductase subunit G
VKKQAWLILCIISLIAGLALSVTNMVTAGPIEEQRVKTMLEARAAVFPAADNFIEIPLAADSAFDNTLEAQSGGVTIGYVIQITVSGYGGPVEIIMGVDLQGVITGLSVGGSKFAETAGLGTKVRQTAFTGQFVGLSEMPTLNGNVDTISGATISSSAVINGVIKCYEQWETVAGANGTSPAN